MGEFSKGAFWGFPPLGSLDVPPNRGLMGITLYRYILKEQLVPFALAAFGLSFVLVAGRMMQLARYLFTTSVTFMDLLQLILLILPKLLMFTLPMAALMATVLAFVRMNGDNELTALHSAGLSMHQLLPAILTLVVAITGFSYINTLMVVPKANKAFDIKLKSLGKATVPLLLRDGVFIDVVPNLVFFFRSADASTMSIRGFFVEDQRHPDIRATIVAQKASIYLEKDEDHLVFRIENGVITRVPENQKGAQAVSFKTYDLFLSLEEIMGGSAENTRRRQNMTAMELIRHSSAETTSKEQEASLLMELHRRLALPFSCLILGILGVPLGVVSRQKSRMTGIALGLGIFLTYYVLLTAGRGLAENLIIPPFAAAWGPNVLCALLAGFLWMKAHDPAASGPDMTSLELWKNRLLFLGKRIRLSSKQKP